MFDAVGGVRWLRTLIDMASGGVDWLSGLIDKARLKVPPDKG